LLCEKKIGCRRLSVELECPDQGAGDFDHHACDVFRWEIDSVSESLCKDREGPQSVALLELV